ncbi:MAG: c-type cytochrome [Gammaproteobacteria bacterium]
MKPGDSALIFLALVMVSLSSPLCAGSSDGEQVFTKWCTPCHADSPFAPGTIQLGATRGAERAPLHTRDDLSDAYLRTFVREGFAGMPKFRRTEISEADLDALVQYLVKK